jgi:hypothetical protein
MTEKNFDLSKLNGNNGFIVEGINDDNLGYSVSNAGDLNGDGIEDIVIGSPLSDPNNKSNSGKTYVIFGSKEGFSKTFDLSTLNGTNGFVVNGAGEGDESGRSVSAIGDINGDGIDDLAIGAPFADINGVDSGASYVIFGSKAPNHFSKPIELLNLDPAKGFTIRGSQAGNNVGWSVSSAGDINGDSIKDLLIGATNSGGNSGPGIKGESYVIFGKKGDFGSGSSLKLSNLGLKEGLRIISNEPDNLGYSVSDAGDINGDGVNDLIIGAPYADPNGTYNAGQSYVIYGRSSDKPFTNNVINVSTLSSSNGFVINGENGGKSGYFISKAGDINGDGISDLIIGAKNASVNGQEWVGKTYIVFGNKNGFGSSLNVSDLNGSNGFTINGINAFDNSGYSVSNTGDINNDGIDDLILGAPNANNRGGETYVIYGSKAGFSKTLELSSLNGDNGFVINGLVAGDLGISVSGAGDVNGDGIKDVIIAAPFANSQAGAAYVVFGNSVNKAPTGLELSNNSLGENAPINTVIGSFSTSDPNIVDTFTYSLVAGNGDTDNGSFTISNNQLKTNSVLNYEDKDSYKIRVKTTDKGGLSVEKELTIGLTDVNENPTGLLLDNSTVAENEPVGTAVGTFTTQDPDAGNTFAYSLVAGSGDTDNGLFTITDHQLKTNSVFNYEEKNSYNIRVKTTDQDGLSVEKELTIGITDVNETPTDLSLDNNTVAENEAVGTVVGRFTTEDPDGEDTFTYSLVTGDGDSDNSLFTITDHQLKTNSVFNYEDKNSYNIRVKTTDQDGLSFEEELTIGVTDVSEKVSSDFLTQISDDVFNIKGNNGNAKLKVSLIGSNSNSVNEVGVFNVDDALGRIDGIAPGEEGYAEAALQRSQVIFSILTNLPVGVDPNSFARLLEFKSDDNLRFYLVKDGSKDSVINKVTPIGNVLFPSPDDLRITNLGDDGFSLGWEDGSGNGNGFEDLQLKIQPTDQIMALGTSSQNQLNGEAVDLRTVTGAVNAEFVVNREALYNNFVGFYRVTDGNGGIDTDGDGNADLLPGQDGYIQAALNGRIPDLNLSVDNTGTANFTATLQGGGIYVPFLIADGRPDALLDSNPNNNPNIYFTFLGANSDGVDHVRILGDNTFGFEDLFGGGDNDFNDLIVKVNLTSVA